MWCRGLVAVLAPIARPCDVQRALPESFKSFGDVLEDVAAQLVGVQLGLRRPEDPVVLPDQPGVRFHALAEDSCFPHSERCRELGPLLDGRAVFVDGSVLALVAHVVVETSVLL